LLGLQNHHWKIALLYAHTLVVLKFQEHDSWNLDEASALPIGNNRII
jgi:hypothetical protein